MTRRNLLHLMAAAVAGRRVAAPAGPSKFPGTPFRDYARCLPDYLRRLAAQAAARRNAEIARLVSPAAIEARQKWVRATLWSLIGGMPERTALNPRTTGGFEQEEYRLEKVIYESRPGLFVTANLYIPTRGAAPYPAVLFQSGHYEQGKAYPNYQRCCQALARLGFVVLAFDPMGQGERVAYLASSGTRSRLSDVDSEHTTPGKQMLLYGDTATRFQLWDSMRSMDYLISLPFVDAKRIGSTGHSGGGTLTMLLAAADERLAAAAPCMGNTENVASTHFVPPGSTDDAEQDFVNSGPAGFDRWDLFYPFAPKPMLIWPSDRDFYSTYSSQYIANGWEEFQKLRAVYEVMQQSDRLKWADTPLPHSLAQDSRLLIYNWFSRWLKNETAPIVKEPATQPQPYSRLLATESGNVVRSLGSLTPFAMNKARQVQRHPEPLDRLLKVTRPTASTATILSTVRSGVVNVQALEVASAPGVWLPGWILTADNGPVEKPALLVLDPYGAEHLWFQPDADSAVPAGSPVICAVDIRGVGALQPEFSPGAAEYAAWHAQEENYAWGSLILGEPLVSQRVVDILAAASSLRSKTQGRPVRLAASGKLTVPALFAAALDPEIESVYLSGGLASFQSLVDSEQYNHPFANFVPGLLNHTDLPEVAASLAPRRLVLAGPVDGQGHTLAQQTAGKIYAAGNITIEPDPQWSAARLLAYAGG